ncbi:TipAS antibiotic-recognition domain-containing protein [Colwelliaceae bacterium BS250]
MNDINKPDNQELSATDTPSAELERWEKIARERDGDEKVDERLEQLAQLSMEDTLELKEKADALNVQIATTSGLAIESEAVQSVVKQYLDYTEFALSTLQNKPVTVDFDKFIDFAHGIVENEDKKAAFEHLGNGLAKHFSAAMVYFAGQNLK